ncbi:hypothetical protein HAX54_048236 [Datura stramonium]|uniref:Uncharacterized protein n=1 Tax=Datura stramonium TaxID=4076 RepID=A0ABS8WJ27_DATST|nr:hypothetical protein [Datura stramonium]
MALHTFKGGCDGRRPGRWTIAALPSSPVLDMGDGGLDGPSVVTTRQDNRHLGQKFRLFMLRKDGGPMDRQMKCEDESESLKILQARQRRTLFAVDFSYSLIYGD